MFWWKKRTHKYNAAKTSAVFDGVMIEFSSKLEAAVASEIERLRELGVASDLRCQHSVTMKAGNFVRRWKVDFSYFDNQIKETVWVEAKGKETCDFKYKRDMWKSGAGPGRLEIWKGDYRAGRVFPKCVDVVYPHKKEEGGVECE